MAAKNISVVMPYYSRVAALKETLKTYGEFYGDDVEIIVVDDGSPLPLALDEVKVITLPRKEVGYSPVIPINVGVEYATHDLIVLTLPEVSHNSPVLYRMRDVWSPNAYVMAQCWCKTMKRWLASPDDNPVSGLQQGKPKGMSFNFCVMLHRSLWEEVGGMSRDYRWGSHYDDTDFAHKIAASGADLKWVDDVTTHTREGGAKAPWVRGGISINSKIFESRWGV